MDGALKRILKTPPTTPSEIITAETGIMDIDTTWKKKTDNLLPQHHDIN